MSTNLEIANKTIPNERALLDNLGCIAYTLDKTYLSQLENDYVVLPFDRESDKSDIYYNRDGAISYTSNIRALQVERWVCDQDEKISDCFKNVLSVFAGSDSSVALVVERTPTEVNMFFVTKNTGAGRNEDIANDIALLDNSLHGNFPGSETHVKKTEDIKKRFDFSEHQSVAVLCNVPSEKSQDYISQGIDKLLNGIVPKTKEESYTVVILAEALPQIALRQILSGYQEMATAITPYTAHQFQLGKNRTDTEGEMESLSNSKGISHSVNKTQSTNVGINGGVFSSVATTVATAVGASLGVPFIGAFASLTKALTTTVGQSMGASAGYGYNWGTSDTDSLTDTRTRGMNSSVSLGSSENTTYSYKSYLVADLIEKLEATMKRINKSQSTGLWKCASYILSRDAKQSKNVANFLRSITQGDESYIEPSFIQEWSYESGGGYTCFGEIRKYLRHFCHPVFLNRKDGTPVTPTMNVATGELADVFAFPRYSVQGLPVVKCARFGREPHSLIELHADVKIGCSYHMHVTETNNPISLGKDELAKHTFITGSTGSGKSNTICKIIERLCFGKQADTKFLVIEPAKGEYKEMLGGRENVAVYGTNPFKTPLLHINPFSFPSDIHVLEHVDRLVEVFNACWPMYAAMPAILKEAVEKAYEEVGWNLKLSKNPGEFPTFDTLLSVLPGVIDTSGYSADTSNDYKGALVTRVRSLTRGIHGQIFASDIANEKLFNENVIVDISRVGSSETKALIMGILVLKLQEFRMSETGTPNSRLRHITVLEEAHHLLRRTAGEQSQESSNLQGKSVEMLANAIAEMRTYGEGFIIADQSPGVMDMAVIRNTNTKIIHRLPDESDRELVGKSAGLNDTQVDELARLELGVAAISQSDWIEPVLCKIDRFNVEQSSAESAKPGHIEWSDDEDNAIQSLLRAALVDVERVSFAKDAADKIRKWYDKQEVSEKGKLIIEAVLDGKQISEEQQLVLIYNVVGKRKLDKLPAREEAVAEVEKTLKCRYGLPENDEIIPKVNELFLHYFPGIEVLNRNIEQTEHHGKEVR